MSPSILNGRLASSPSGQTVSRMTEQHDWLRIFWPEPDHQVVPAAFLWDARHFAANRLEFPRDEISEAVHQHPNRR